MASSLGVRCRCLLRAVDARYSTVLIGIYVLDWLSLICYGPWQHPQKLSQLVRMGFAKLFYFLFFSYRPEGSYYGFTVCLRGCIRHDNGNILKAPQAFMWAITELLFPRTVLLARGCFARLIT